MGQSLPTIFRTVERRNGKMSNVSIPYNYPKKCLCCNEGTIQDFHDVCLICGWEDDEIQNDDPTYGGGANKDSLEQHREAFLQERSHNKRYMWCNTWK